MKRVRRKLNASQLTSILDRQDLTELFSQFGENFACFRVKPFDVLHVNVNFSGGLSCCELVTHS